MVKTRRSKLTGLLCLAGMLMVQGATAAAAAPPRCPAADLAAINNYVPTAAKMQALTEAVTALTAAAAKDPALAAMLANKDASGMCSVDDNLSMQSVAGIQAEFDKNPRLAAFYTSRGINARELASWGTLSLKLAFASVPEMAAAAKKEMTPAQQAFARDNAAGVQKLVAAMTAMSKVERRAP